MYLGKMKTRLCHNESLKCHLESDYSENGNNERTFQNLRGPPRFITHLLCFNNFSRFSN